MPINIQRERNAANAKAFEDSGYKRYKYSAILDKRTSDVCRALDGQIFDFENRKAGENFPPMHPWCRSSFEVVVEDEVEVSTETPKVEQEESYSKESIEAMERYVSGEGQWINQYLRKGENLSPEDMEYLKALDEITSKKISQDVLYRSVDASVVFDDFSGMDFENLLEALVYGQVDGKNNRYNLAALNKAKTNIGKTIEDKGFMSTTKNKNIAVGFRDFTGAENPIVLKIKTNKNTKGVDVNAVDGISDRLKESEKDSPQKEVLLARGQKYKVKDIYAEEGEIFVDVELEDVKILNKANSGGIIKEIDASGALNPLGDRAQEHAERQYEAIRKKKTDVVNISKNTDISEKEILSIKNYLFVDEHELTTGVRRFEPSFEIAESWKRLENGKDIQKHDLTLLMHEIEEKRLIKKGMTQYEAHIIATKMYNYQKESDEFYGNIKKYKKE